MYAAKDAGRNRYAFYTEELGGNALAFVALESRLRKAIDDAQLRLFYQPQFRLRDGALIGVEALIRWPGAQPEHRSPAVFIPVAEMSGLIEPLGHWVLEEACGQIVQWQQAGFDFGQVAINLSCRQLNILAGHRVDGSLLEFEITESMVVKEGGIAHANLEAFNGALR
jgi:EAL domain-containing protein (putative c-di-GMP-specific phosphodiesterase class I)